MIVDLSHTINSIISVYPGTAPPQLEQLSTVQQDGFAEMKLVLNSHSATHVDAPAHMTDKGKTLDKFDPAQFIGAAQVVDCREVVNCRVTLAHLQSQLAETTHLDFVLLCTGWSAKWGTAAYLSNYPVLTEEAAQWLATLPVKGIGMDTISPDTIESAHYPIHHIFFKRDLLIIENLTNLELLMGKVFQLLCLPLKIENADAAPARAIARLEETNKFS